ncbi:MAG: VOC family protein [Actinomycetota bacterium]|nr:VOC family protein [Actinomycetota bacterium]
MDRPSIDGVLETVLYCTSANEAQVHQFYSDTLGLRRLGPGSSAYRAGTHVLLVFNRDATSDQQDPPPHGASGPIHTCFTAPPRDYERWQTHLLERNVATFGERTWGNGVRSFYFEDPAGNLLEIADGDLWPR